eukprot:1541118-Rhodomonas_salina.1
MENGARGRVITRPDSSLCREADLHFSPGGELVRLGFCCISLEAQRDALKRRHVIDGEGARARATCLSAACRGTEIGCRTIDCHHFVVDKGLSLAIVLPRPGAVRLQCDDQYRLALMLRLCKRCA